ncbi:MAG: type II toxin-antitoxin system HicB family antitoxin, partial [Desulfomonilia bacterium]
YVLLRLNRRLQTESTAPDTEDGGYWAECPEIPGCVSQGDTIRETLEMIKDAIDGCLNVIKQNENISKAL